jgi:pyruvate/2-oxoglutarate dehydrogenase complex dihydrolipoamide acyltransferase (E2) component
MARALAMLESASTTGRKLSPTALYLRAAALALVRLPKLHRMIVGSRQYLYDRVDLCLSVSGKSAMAPRMILRDAGNKTWVALAEEVRSEVPRIRDAEAAELDVVRRWGWIVPFRALRRAVLRRLRTLPRFREQKLGTFQVSVLRDVDLFVPLQFGTAAILAAGGVRDRVRAVNGELVKRPTVFLTCSFNHKVWDGMSARHFLLEVQDILESGVLEAEGLVSGDRARHPSAGAGT